MASPAPKTPLDLKPKLKFCQVNLTWSEEEKGQLLKALRKYGINDIDLLAKQIPTKSVAEIKSAIFNYERAAVKSLKGNESAGEERQAPIDIWLRFLKEYSIDVYATRDIVTALKIIALNEEEKDTCGINLASCYEYLVDLMNGKAPKQLNDESIHFIMSCFGKLAKLLKSEDTRKEEEFLKKLHISEVLQKTYLSKKGNVIGDPSLNLLKVPLSLLRIQQSMNLN